MTPKEKSIELLDKYLPYVEAFSETQQLDNAKKCALIAVDELLESHWDDRGCGIGSKVQFYRMVKSEINKL
jgi:hypothetical protein